VAPFRVIGNIYYVGAAGVAAYLIVTPDGDILLDTGTREMVPLVRDSIAKLGFQLADIKILLSGHAHWDHVQGHAAIQRATSAQVMAMAGDAETLASGGDPSLSSDERWDPVPVDRVLHDGDTVSLGGTTMTAVWAPGHTPGCTVWTTTVTERERPYSIAFYACAGPSADMQLVGNPQFPDLSEQSLSTFHRLKQLTPDVYLMMHAWDQFVSHPDRLRATTTPHPLYDPSAWRRVLDEDEADLRTRIAAQRAKMTGTSK
jgi:metallo-beta-lactamase class B